MLPDPERLLSPMVADLRTMLKELGLKDPGMVGIQTGGAWIAQRLHRELGLTTPLGTLDITFYRDDFTQIGLDPEVRPSLLPFDVNDRGIILVDDVLYTGRTIRAALNELFDYGRPALVLLVVLVERDGRELPIQADVVGHSVTLDLGEQVRLTGGPDRLQLVIRRESLRH